MRPARILPETFFLITILVAGSYNALVTPLGAGFDEDTHFARVWEITQGEVVPNRYLGQGERFPSAFREVSYRQFKNMTPVSREMWVQMMRVRIDPNDLSAHQTRSVYFPLLYLPQALVMLLVVQVLNAPVAVLYYLSRLASLGLYAALTYLAIRRLPFGKWAFAVLALAPMAVIQASVVSPDGLDNGVAFLFIAWAVYWMTREGEPLSRREFLTTLGLIVLLCAGKPATPVLLLLLLGVPRSVFGSGRRRWIVLGTAMGSALIITAGWNVVVGIQVGVDSPLPGVNSSEQLAGMIANPFSFARAVLLTYITQAWRLLSEWIGVAGYAAWRIPSVVYPLYAALLVYSGLSESRGTHLTQGRRRLMVLTFAVHLGVVAVFLYAGFNPVGAPLIAGIQGRYFLVSAPLLVLALLPARPLILRSITLISIGTALVLAIVLAATTLAYHVVCGDSWFTPGMCSLPKYKNWGPDRSPTIEVTSDHFAWQDFVPECDRLEHVRVWTRWRGEPGEGTFKLTLVEQESEEELAESVFDLSQVPSEGWLEFRFPQIAESAKVPYLLKLRPVEMQDEEALRLVYFATDEYFEGSAWRDGNRLPGDLVFQYACRAGLGQLLASPSSED